MPLLVLLALLARRRPAGTGLDVAELYSRYAGMVLRRVRRFYGEQEAEEVVHEVFLRVLEKQHTFRAESSVVTWLYHLTTNHCLNRLRNQRRRQQARLAWGAHPWDPPSQPADGETTTFLSEVWRQLDGELLAVGTYHFVDGLTHAEIARILGVSRRTVGNRVAELQRRVRDAARPAEE